METPPDILARFALLFAGLRTVIGAHIARDRNAGPWLIAVWQQLSRVAAGIERIAAQIRAGTVPPLRAGFTLGKPRKPPTRPAIVLANHSFWLGDVIQQTAVYGGWLRQMLDHPDMAAMLKAAPQLARILRPLCRALGVEPPPLPPRPALRALASPDPAAPAATPPDAPRGAGGSARPPPARRRRARPRFVWPAPILATPAQKPA